MENFSIDDPQCHPDFRRADKLKLFSEKGLCWLEWPDEPWNIKYYISSRGHDNFHIYLWILKDMSWLQGWFWCGHIFGGLALAWIWFIILKSLWNREKSQAWIGFSQFIWLLANFLWMSGELYDSQYPHRKHVYNERNALAGHLLITALSMIGVYYVVVLPYQRFFYTRKDKEAIYHPTDNLSTRCPDVFSSWTDYENVHVLFWLGKDVAWNREIPAMWVVFMIPTLLVGSDFAWKTLVKKRLVIDHAHYAAQLFWVLSNAIWAAVELFFPNSSTLDKTVGLLDFSSQAFRSGRWYASWVLVVASVPLGCLYGVWLYGTLSGSIDMPQELSLKNRLRLYESILTSDEDDHRLPSESDIEIMCDL